VFVCGGGSHTDLEGVVAFLEVGLRPFEGGHYTHSSEAQQLRVLA
jgi:hypothetical protein